MTELMNINRRAFIGVAGAAGAALTFLSVGRANGASRSFDFALSDSDWRKRLGPERYRILREAGTEAPYSSPLNKEHRRGTFVCAGCGLPLFSSTTKFDSGTGWPSFYAALPNAIRTRKDGAFGMSRTEEHCRRCGGHLGHVFDDGPKPTGKRHCING